MNRTAPKKPRKLTMTRTKTILTIIAIMFSVACSTPVDSYCKKLAECVGATDTEYNVCVDEYNDTLHEIRSHYRRECNLIADAFEGLIGCWSEQTCLALLSDETSCSAEDRAIDKALDYADRVGVICFK